MPVSNIKTSKKHWHVVYIFCFELSLYNVVLLRFFWYNSWLVFICDNKKAKTYGINPKTTTMCNKCVKNLAKKTT